MRYRQIGISASILQSILTEGWSSIAEYGEGMAALEPMIYANRCKKGLPEGAHFIGFSPRSLDCAQQVVWLIFEHESFDDVAPGAEIPEFAPVFEQYRVTRLGEAVGV